MHPSKIGELVKKEIYQLAGSRIAAFETDSENIQSDGDNDHSVKQAFYIMDDNQKIHHIVMEAGDVKFKEEAPIDFSMHDQLKEVTKLRG